MEAASSAVVPISDTDKQDLASVLKVDVETLAEWRDRAVRHARYDEAKWFSYLIGKLKE